MAALPITYPISRFANIVSACLSVFITIIRSEYSYRSAFVIFISFLPFSLVHHSLVVIICFRLELLYFSHWVIIFSINSAIIVYLLYINASPLSSKSQHQIILFFVLREFSTITINSRVSRLSLCIPPQTNFANLYRRIISHNSTSRQTGRAAPSFALGFHYKTFH